MKAALADRSRFRFKEQELDLSEYIVGLKLKLKSLSVGERDALPELTKPNPDGRGEVADFSIPKLAAVFAAVVENPKVTAEEAEGFLADWPGEALDLVMEKFGEMVGGGEEQKAAARTFPESG